MKKILVPTDFSTNSKSGIRFAIQWAAQQDLELVYIHVLKVLVPTRWSQGTVADYVARELQACRERFKKFLDGVYKSMNVEPRKYSIVLVQEHDPALTIMDYCRKEKTIDCICISTNGAGGIKKLLGTNTSLLISRSPVPVLAIPRNYRPKIINRVLYASDFRNYKAELDKVLQFAAAFKAQVDVVHFAWPGEPAFDKEILENYSRDYEHGLNVYLEENNAELPLTKNLYGIIAKRKPAIVIMFTNQQRTFLQRLFLSSKAEELSFSLRTPLLVYSKAKTAIKTGKHELA